MMDCATFCTLDAQSLHSVLSSCNALLNAGLCNCANDLGTKGRTVSERLML